MKRILIVAIASLSIVSFGQNVTENKMTFGYTQLPLNPIDNDYTTYNVVVERSFEQANQDSLLAYQTKLEIATAQYDAEIMAWQEKRKIILRTYLQQMSTWQKAVNAGTAATKPVDPVYPTQPIMQVVKEPMMHSDILDNTVTNNISLDGFDYSDGGATITIGVSPISDFRIVNEKKTTGTTTKYNYTVNYRLPINVKVESPSQGVVYNTVILNDLKVYRLETYMSQYDFDLWWLDNEASFWSTFEAKVRVTALASTKIILNDQCGYPVKTRNCEIYTVKKFKEHKYNDLTNAYTASSQGYVAVGSSRDHSGAENKLNEAIRIWKQVLTESNPGDKKSRVNDKVTALCYCNLAEAYLWLNDFDQALQNVNLAKSAGVGKFKRIAGSIEGVITENRTRFNANK